MALDGGKEVGRVTGKPGAELKLPIPNAAPLVARTIRSFTT